MKSIVFKQVVKGTDVVKFQGNIDGTPEDAGELMELLTAGGTELQNRVRIALVGVVEATAKSVCNRAETAGEIIPSEFDFAELLSATSGPKRTAKFMCDKLNEEIMVLNAEARQARKSGDLDAMDAAFEKIEEKEEALAQWEEKREEERKAKAASRARNK